LFSIRAQQCQLECGNQTGPKSDDDSVEPIAPGAVQVTAMNILILIRKNLSDILHKVESSVPGDDEAAQSRERLEGPCHALSHVPFGMRWSFRLV
jgi:hypothetical protein